MRGSNKSGCLDFALTPLLDIETEEQERDEADFRTRHADENVGKPKKMRVVYDRRESQRVIQGGTLQGLEEVLVSKNKEATASVILAHDEITLLMSSQNRDADYEATFLSMYSGSTIKKNTKTGGYIDIKNPFIQVCGFSQPDTILNEYSKKDDTGGKYDRFLMSYAKVKYKNLSNEGNLDVKKTFNIAEVKFNIFRYQC